MKSKKKKFPKVKNPPSHGVCFNCNVSVSDTFYCYGCGEFVCDACEPPEELWELFVHGREHKPDDHLVRIIQFPRGFLPIKHKLVIIDCLKTAKLKQEESQALDL